MKIKQPLLVSHDLSLNEAYKLFLESGLNAKDTFEVFKQCAQKIIKERQLTKGSIPQSIAITLDHFDFNGVGMNIWQQYDHCFAFESFLFALKFSDSRLVSELMGLKTERQASPPAHVYDFPSFLPGKMNYEYLY